MKNRYGVEYSFRGTFTPNVYKFVSEEETKYARFGGKEGDPGINMDDLGFFDPSGGPFISEGFVIDGKRVKRIFANDGDVFFEVK